MPRWIIVLLFVLGFACAFQVSLLVTPACAFDITPPEKTEDTTITATPNNGITADTGTTDSGTTKPASDIGTPKKVFPSKAMIREMFEDGKLDEAEAAYLEWATYWRDDDATLIVLLERQMLLRQFREGKNSALIAMAQVGDAEALTVLTAQVLSGGGNWPPADLIPAIRFIGASRDKNSLNTLRTVLYSQDAGVVNATISALGDLGDPRIVPELVKMFEDADLERSVALARTLVLLGAKKQVQDQFEPQLRFPLAGVRERAALVLGAIGIQTGWPLIQQMLETQQEGYYPLALKVLAALPSNESEAYLMKALDGSEAEQLAALQSINILSPQKSIAVLMALLKNDTAPTSVRVSAVQMLADRRVPIALKPIRALASKLEGDAPQVKAEAVLALAKYGLLDDQMMRETVRQRFTSPDEDVARAARAVLFGYALSVK